MLVVLNGVPPRGTKEAQAREVLDSLGVPVCPVSCGYRAAFDHAGTLGLSVQEYDPRGKAASEIAAVYRTIINIVNSQTTKGVN